jgi:hypothetical protein
MYKVKSKAAMQTELPETKINGIAVCSYRCEITLLPTVFLNLFSFRTVKNATD